MPHDVPRPIVRRRDRNQATRRWGWIVLLALALFGNGLASEADAASAPKASEHPNVILIITDDQGYGDLACHGNTMINTPNLDHLYSESVRLTDFHVCPTCAPTRSMLMTGRNNNRVGVWHTTSGRSLLRRDEKTMAELFSQNGYATCMVGKWHLGDSYPYRPGDRGFDEWTNHYGGGVGQTPDHWGNDYFDDTFDHNGKLTTYKGYCTDVFFREAEAFIRKDRDKPFFLYIATNTPHSPLNVAPELAQPYLDKGVPPDMARFYAMITNIDTNVGGLMKTLKETGRSEDTVVIFMTDNGSANGILFPKRPERMAGKWIGFNAGMRGKKGSQYDGGHRVPCFFWYPTSWKGGEDVTQLTAAADILPTLVQLCHLKGASDIDFDGASLMPLLDNPGGAAAQKWSERTLVVDSQRVEDPIKWRQSSVMTPQWRLVDGKELYDIKADPGEKTDVATAHPDLVEELRHRYDDWWNSVSERFDEYCPIVIGAVQQPTVTLCCHDWHGERAESSQDRLSKDLPSEGVWKVDVARPGRYRFTLRERPAQVNYSIDGDKAMLRIGDQKSEAPVPSGAKEVSFTRELKAGPTDVVAGFEDSSGKVGQHGAYYVETQYVGPAE